MHAEVVLVDASDAAPAARPPTPARGRPLDEERPAPRRFERQKVRWRPRSSRPAARAPTSAADRRSRRSSLKSRVRSSAARRLTVTARDGLKPGSCCDEPLEAAREQRRADQQHHRQADLGDDEHAARAPPRAAAVAAAARFLERPLHVAARHQHRRHDAERDRRQRRERDREQPARVRRPPTLGRSRGTCTGDAATSAFTDADRHERRRAPCPSRRAARSRSGTDGPAGRGSRRSPRAPRPRARARSRAPAAGSRRSCR